MQVVICGVEDAHADRDVLRVAAGLSERVGGRLILMHVQPPPLIELEPQIAYAAPQPERDQLAVARELARVAAGAGVAPSTEVRVAYGALEPQLLVAAREEEATAVVVGPGPASRLVGRARCPLVVVPATAPPRGGDIVSVPKGGDMTSSIVCGVDGSRHARLALRHAARLAELMEARLVVVHVVQLPLPSPRVGPTAGQLTVPLDALLTAGESLLERLVREEGLAGVERRVSIGFPAGRLADAANEEGAELVVVGSRGRGRIKAALLGSVSNDLIGVAPCPVLVVPPQAPSPNGDRVREPVAVLARAA